MSQAEATFGAGEAGGARGFGQRVLGAVRLEPGAWHEIATEPGALGQAVLVVAAAAVAGAAVAAGEGRMAAVESCVASLGFWLGFAGLLWAVANWFRHPLGLGAALRVVGFAMAPLLLVVLAAIPVEVVQSVVRLVAFALFLGALVAGTRQALRVETARAALVCVTAGLALVFLVTLAVALGAGH
jgi:hypothetical protein